MFGNEALYKLLEMETETVSINGDLLRIVPDGAFSDKEIEDLRAYQARKVKMGDGYTIANFLPDDLRPAHVKKL